MFEPTIKMDEDLEMNLKIIYSINDPVYLIDSSRDLAGEMLDILFADISAQADKITEMLKSIDEKWKEIFPRYYRLCERLKISVVSVHITSMKKSLESRLAHERNVKLSNDFAARQEKIGMENKFSELELEGKTLRSEKQNEFDKQELGRKIQLKKMELESEAEFRSLSTKDLISFLNKLKELNVDLTQFVCEVVKSQKKNVWKDGKNNLIQDISNEILKQMSQQHTDD